MTKLAASSVDIPRYCTNAQISLATASRMKYSPTPVEETAQDRLDAYVPAPITGESPTRPGSLPCIPPVDVPAARSPRTSRATAPTVPYLWAKGRCAELLLLLSGPGGTPSGRGG